MNSMKSVIRSRNLLSLNRRDAPCLRFANGSPRRRGQGGRPRKQRTRPGNLSWREDEHCRRNPLKPRSRWRTEKRNAIERMIAAYPGLRHSAPAASGETKDRYALFDTSLKNGEFYGEDYTFCDRWRAIDGKILVDKDIALRHVGTTRTPVRLEKFW